MADRGQFWSPIPDWQSVALERDGVRIAPVAHRDPMHMISGDLNRVLAKTELASLGPRDRCDGQHYALRLAPDRLLAVGLASVEIGWSPEGFAVSDVTDGYLRFDILGPDADSVMAFGGHYDWHAEETRPQESAIMLFAGLKTIVGRLESGWLLHIERSLAPSLWRWLEKI